MFLIIDSSSNGRKFGSDPNNLGSNPRESTNQFLYRLIGRTPSFEVGNAGSNPDGGANRNARVVECLRDTLDSESSAANTGVRV